MNIILYVTAECDPPPDGSAFDEPLDDLEDALEDAVANWLVVHNAGFSIHASHKVEV